MRKITRFLREAYTELRKVVWPTRRRTARLTLAVAIVTIMFSAFLASVDYGLSKGIKHVVDSTQKTAAPAQPAQGTQGQPANVQTLPQTAPNSTTQQQPTQ